MSLLLLLQWLFFAVSIPDLKQPEDRLTKTVVCYVFCVWHLQYLLPSPPEIPRA
jgi:hypothetical protein